MTGRSNCNKVTAHTVHKAALNKNLSTLRDDSSFVVQFNNS